MSDRNLLLEKTTALVKDVSNKLSPADYDQIISHALKQYSKHRPGETAVDVTGNGTHNYLLSSISGWVEGFSNVGDVEYPVGNVPPTMLDDEDWMTYLDPTGRMLRTLSTISSPATFRVFFTIPRTDATIPDQDVDAVALLAASLCLEVIATRYVDASDPTIAADVVNYRSKSSEAASRAKQYMKLYKEHVDIKEDSGSGAAMATASQDVDYPGGFGRLTHPARQRRQRFS